MTFDAGSIEATFDVDRTPFQQGLAAAKREAEEFANKRYVATVDVRTRGIAETRREIKSALEGLGKQHVISVRADTRTSGDLNRVQQDIAKVGQATKAATDDANANINVLFDSIAILGPALVPLASGLAGIGSSLVGIGIDAKLAFTGAKTEIAQATVTGQKFAGGLALLSSDVAQLQRTAAKGILSSFVEETKAFNQQLPQINDFVARTAPLTGQILASGASALLKLFTAAEPLIVTAETEVGKLFDKLDNWSGGQQAKDFFQSLADDIPIVVQFIGDAGTAFANLVQAIAPVGHAVLETVDGVLQFVNLLDRVPGLLTTLVTGFVAWRAATLAGVLASKLAAAAGLQEASASEKEAVASKAAAVAAIQHADSLDIVAASAARASIAQRGYGATTYYRGNGGFGPPTLYGTPAGAAGPGLLGRIGSGALTALPYLFAASLGVGGLNAAINGPNNTRGTASGAGGFAKETIGAVNDLLHFDFGFGSTHAQVAADRRASEIASRQSQIDHLADPGFFQSPNLLQRFTGTPDRSSLLGGFGAASRGLSNGNNAVLYIGQQQRAIQQSTSALGRQGDPQAIADGNQLVTQSIQHRIDAESKLFDTSKGSIKLGKDLTVSADEYDRVLAAMGGNLNRTTQYFQAHSIALGNDKEALKTASDQQANYSQFLADATGKYKLTTTQVGIFTAALGLNYDKISKTSQGAQLAASVLGQVRDSFLNGNSAMQGWLSTISQVDLSTDTLNQRVTILGAGLRALRGVQLDMAGTNLQAASSIETVANTIEQNNKSIGRHGQLLGQLIHTNEGWIVQQPKLTAGSLQIQQAMVQAGDAAISLAQSIYQNTGNANAALAAYSGLRQQFISTEVQAGKTKDQAKQLANQIYGVPKNAKTFVQLLNKDNVAGAIRSLTAQLGTFSKTIASAIAKLDTGQFDLSWEALMAKLRGLNNTTVSPHVALPTEPVLTTIGGGTGGGEHSGPARADGGIIPASWGKGPRADDVMIWASGGEFVVNAASYAKHATLVQAINADKFASGGQVPSLITSGGTGSSSSGGGSARSGGGLSAFIKSTISTLTSDISSVASAASTPLATLTKQLDALDATLTKLHSKGLVNQGEVDLFERDTARLSNLAKSRDNILTALNKAKNDLTAASQASASERTSVRDTVLGSLDIGTAGNGYRFGILQTVKDKAADVTKFEKLRAQAKALGLRGDLLKQITEEGPEVAGKNLAAIVGGGKGYISQINAAYAPISTVAARLGTTQANDLYAKRMATDTADIRKLGQQQRDNSKAMKDEIVRVRKDLQGLIRQLKTGGRTR